MPATTVTDANALLVKLPKRQRSRLMSLITPVSVKAGRVLAVQGSVGREFLFISEGTATVRHDGAVVARLGPGNFFGEISLVTGAVRTAEVTAESDMQLLVLNRSEFTAMLNLSPELAKSILTRAARRLHAINMAKFN